MKRPLVPVALFYGGGVLLGEFFPQPLRTLFVCSFALAVAAIFLSRARKILIWPLIVCVGWTNFVFRTAIISPNDLRLTQTHTAEIVTLRGTLTETPGQRVFIRGEQESWHTLARIHVREMCKRGNWQPAFGDVAVTTPGILGEKFFAGQTVEITGVLAPPQGPIAKGLFDWQKYLRRQQIYFQLKTEGSNDWQILAPEKFTPPLADRFRAWAGRALARGIPAEDESLRLERALTLGDKTVLTDDVSEPFVRAATYHIFAVDGLRMAIIFGIFFALFRALGLPRAWCGMMLIPLIWFYTALTGWPPSAIRATVMLTVIIVGWLLRRPSDLLNSLFAAALIILVWDPQQIFQAGFQLSFVVVLCLILTLPTFDAFTQWLLKSDPLLPEDLRPRWQKMLLAPARFLLDFLFTSTAAWLGSIPLAAFYFHVFTPVSGPANLVAVPLCALALASNLISLLLASWFPAGAEIFNHAGWFLMECIRVSSQWFAHWPAAYRYVSAPTIFSTALYYAVLLSVLTGWIFKSKWHAGKMSVLILLAIVWLVSWQRDRREIHITILPLNGGSAVYFKSKSQALLVDCGTSNSVEFVMKPFLRAQGVNELPCLALTHGDLRHIGGTELFETIFPVRQIALSTAGSHSPMYRRVTDELKKNPERRRILNRGENLCDWTVVHPGSDEHFSDADDNVLVFQSKFNGTRVLLLSDLGARGQAALLERTNDLRAEIVVACLPDRCEPVCDALLDVIQPKMIVITDSEFPAAKRASEKLRERLSSRGVPALFTRDAGAVELSLSRAGWRASTMSGDAVFGPSIHP
jgi:competence protein ComEC